MLITRMIQPKRAYKGTIISFLYIQNTIKNTLPPVGRASGYCISCSSVSNISVLKNSPKVISRPSQSFFTRLTDTSLRWGSSILYTLEGVTPARFASSLVRMPRSLHRSRNRWATASLTVTKITSKKSIEKKMLLYVRTCVILERKV